MPRRQNPRKRKSALEPKVIVRRRPGSKAAGELFGLKIVNSEIVDSKKSLRDFNDVAKNVVAKYDEGGMPYLSFTKAADKIAAVKERIGKTQSLEEFFKQSG